MAVTRHKYVTFRPHGDGEARQRTEPVFEDGEIVTELDGDRLYLTLGGEWTITGGLQPNCNAAIVPATERAKLSSPDARGTIEFWYSNPPGVGDPDVSLEQQFIVDISPELIGRKPGEIVDTVQTYRICFADHRHAFVEPRGGRLMGGERNPNPLPPFFELVSNRDLIRECLGAMNFPDAPGLPADIPPATVDEVPPARSINWRGEHAPSALAKLLNYCGHVYVPKHAGTGQIVRPNHGALPSIPADRLSSAVLTTSVDRRPKVVVMFSAPTALTKTYDPAAEGGDGEMPPWEFVVQDTTTDKRWIPINSIPGIGADPVAALRRGLPDVDEKHRDHYKRQMYKAIRIDAELFPARQCEILRRVYYPDGRTDQQPSLTIKVATQENNSAWINRTVTLKARTIVSKEGVLVFESRLGRVGATPDDSKPDLDPFFTPVELSELEPTFSAESWHVDRQEKEYGVFAFSRVEGDIVRIEDEEDEYAQLKSFRPGTAIYNNDDLRLIYLNDDADNEDEVEARAMAHAEKLLADAAVNSQVAVIKGFFSIELGGRVSEVRLSQEDCVTIAIVDGWASPAASSHADGGTARDDDPDIRTSAKPHQQPSRTPRSVEAKASAAQQEIRDALAPPTANHLTPEPPALTGFRLILVEVAGPITSQLGRYTARTLNGNLDPLATGNLVLANLGVRSAQPDCELVYTGDLNGTTPGSLKAGDVVLGLAGPVRKSDGKLLVIASGQKAKKKSVVSNVTCSNGSLSVTKEDVWVLDL